MATIEELRRGASSSNGMTVAPVDDGRRQPIDVFRNEASFETAMRMAKALSSTTMVPHAYRRVIPAPGIKEWDLDPRNEAHWIENPAAIGNCLVTMNLANRMGLDILMAMQNVDVIYGRPALRSQLLIAALEQSGNWGAIDYEERNAPDDDTIPKTWAVRAKCRERRSGEVRFGPWVSIKMAHDEGWFSKKGSKWQTMPALMLRYRAAAFFVRQYAPGVAMGMQTAEEILDTVIEGSVVPSTPSVRERASETIKKAQEAQGSPEKNAEDAKQQASADEEDATPGAEDLDEQNPENFPMPGSEEGVWYDIEGVQWDPEFHATGRDGNPVCNQDGTFRRRRGAPEKPKNEPEAGPPAMEPEEPPLPDDEGLAFDGFDLPDDLS